MLSYDFKKYANPYHPFTFGIEIEVSNLASLVRSLTFFKGFYIKEDVSIRGGSTAELVSNPLTAEKLKRNVRALYKSGAIREVNDSCGIHIHVSKKLLTTEKALKIEKFINRDAHSMHIHPIAGRPRNAYWGGVEEYTRYRSVNTRPAYTNEVRIFASSTKSEWVERCIDVVSTMISYSNLDDSVPLEKFSQFFFKKFGYRHEDVKP